DMWSDPGFFVDIHSPESKPNQPDDIEVPIEKFDGKTLRDEESNDQIIEEESDENIPAD
ncbi:hypothetical protein evm_015455, partial [Chilo suppressalis]